MYSKISALGLASEQWSDAAVVIAVKALLTDAMIEADPSKEWPGYTHVSALGDAIAAVCTNAVENGSRVDLTTAP